MASRRSGKPAGFTLVEILVALAIISIALLAALHAAARARPALESCARGCWPARRGKSACRATRHKGAWLPLGVQHGTARQGGLLFEWREEVIPTPHPAFRRVNILVYEGPEQSRPLARLTGFVVPTPLNCR